MSISAIVFYILAVFILGTGILAVTSRKIFRSAIFLLASLAGISGLYFWLELEFIAAVQILVYAGGIVVLIIFSIFLTQQSGKEMLPPPLQRTVWSILSALLGFALMFLLVYNYNFTPANSAFDSGMERIGTQMLHTGEGGYALPFEAVSILLLAAMIGCIVIAMKSTPQEK